MLEKYLKTLLNGGVEERNLGDLAEGMARFHSGAFTEALPLLLRAIEQHADEFQALFAIAKIYFVHGQHDDALPYLKRALALDGKHGELHFTLAEIYVAQPDLDSANYYYQKAVYYDPEFTDAFIRLGCLQVRQNQCEEAVRSFERAIFLDRTAVVARYELARTCYRLGDSRRALTQLHLVRELQDSYAPVYALQGEIFCQLGDWRQAILEIERAHSLGPATINSCYHLGVASQAVGEFDKAVRAYGRLLELDPGHHLAHHRLAQLHERSNRVDLARIHYQVVLQVPEFQEDAMQALARLDAFEAAVSRTMSGSEDSSS